MAVRTCVLSRACVSAMVVFCLLLCAPGGASAQSEHISLIVNDRTVLPDVPPVIRDGRLFVPVRFAMEAVGARVIWIPEDKVAFIRRMPYPALYLKVGSNRIEIDSWWKHNPSVYKPRFLYVESQPFILDGRMMVPIRAIAEHFGCSVEWLDSLRTVKIDARHTSWVSEVVDVKGKAVVLVETDRGLGSGFVIRRAAPERQLRLGVHTCAHVVDGAKWVRVKAYNGKWYDAEVYYADPVKDSAVLDVELGWEEEIGDVQEESYWWSLLPHHIEVGEEVVCIGHPLGLENSVSTGIVSAKRTLPSGVEGYQITAPVSPGSSGCPVFTREGACIGWVIGSIEEGQMLNFVVAG